jgi:hypothetical protein
VAVLTFFLVLAAVALGAIAYRLALGRRRTVVAS